MFPSLIEAIVEWIIGRDISYTYVPGPDHRPRRVAVAGENADAGTTGAYNLGQGSDRDDKNEEDRGDTGDALGGLAFAGIVHAQQKTMSIGTGGTGGVYYPLGGAVANVLSKSLPNVQATAEVTGGSVDNLKLIGAGQSELGFTMADAALDALQGEDKFKSGKLPLQALLVVYPNRMHVVTVEGTGIETMADLKGKRVSTGSPGGATEVMAFRVIEAAGLDKDKDMKRERLGVAESVNAIKDRKIDAFFWVGGIPTAAVTDLAATPGLKMKLIDHGDLAEKMNAKYGKLYTRQQDQGGLLSRLRQGQLHHRGLEPDRHRRQDEQRRRLHHRQDAGGEEGRHRRRAQGSRELLARQPGAGALADPVPSRRAEILQGKGHRRLGFDIRGPDGADALSGRRLR